MAYTTACTTVQAVMRIRRNSVNSASGLITTLTIVFRDHDFL